MLCSSTDGTTHCWNPECQKEYLEVGMFLSPGLVGQSRLDLHNHHAIQRVDANNTQGKNLNISVSQHEWVSLKDGLCLFFITAVNKKCPII
jgi:hypothetical protein